MIADEYHLSIYLSIANPIKPHLKALKESLEEKIKSRETTSISQSYIEFVDKILGDSKNLAATDIPVLREKFEAVREKTGVELVFALLPKYRTTKKHSIAKPSSGRGEDT